MSKKTRCPGCGLVFGKEIGRPRVNVSVPKVLDAFANINSVRGTARELGLSPGLVSKRLQEAKLEKEKHGR